MPFEVFITHLSNNLVPISRQGEQDSLSLKESPVWWETDKLIIKIQCENN